MLIVKDIKMREELLTSSQELRFGYLNRIFPIAFWKVESLSETLLFGLFAENSIDREACRPPSFLSTGKRSPPQNDSL